MAPPSVLTQFDRSQLPPPRGGARNLGAIEVFHHGDFVSYPPVLFFYNIPHFYRNFNSFVLVLIYSVVFPVLIRMMRMITMMLILVASCPDLLCPRVKRGFTFFCCRHCGTRWRPGGEDRERGGGGGRLVKGGCASWRAGDKSLEGASWGRGRNLGQRSDENPSHKSCTTSIFSSKNSGISTVFCKPLRLAPPVGVGEHPDPPPVGGGGVGVPVFVNRRREGGAAGERGMCEWERGRGASRKGVRSCAVNPTINNPLGILDPIPHL